ncbi:MAG TPA: hypothetical protein VGO67_08000 [Verrucomicrobiae bacterium]
MTESKFSSGSGKPEESRLDDYDFRRHLRQTVILLGGKNKIADLLTKSQDFHVSHGDVEDLKRYNMELIDELKSRLSNINKVRIRPKSK